MWCPASLKKNRFKVLNLSWEYLDCLVADRKIDKRTPCRLRRRGYSSVCRIRDNLAGCSLNRPDRSSNGSAIIAEVSAGDSFDCADFATISKRLGPAGINIPSRGSTSYK